MARSKRTTPQEQLAYLRGEVQALRAIVLGIANLTVTGEEFVEESLQRLEVLRTATLPIETHEADAYLDAIDDEEAWVRAQQ